MRIKIFTYDKKLNDIIRDEFKSEDPELIVPIGGDGTFISSIEKYHELNIPFYGIANGTLNFLMNPYKIEDINKLLEYISEKKDIDFIQTPILNYYINNQYQGIAVNEVAYGESIRYYPTIKVSTSKFDKNINASSVAISSPIGSTALNANIGGKIIPMEYPIMTINTIASNQKIHETVLDEPIFITQINCRNEIAILVDNHIKYNMKNHDVLKVEIGKLITIGFDNYKEFEKKRVLSMINQ